MEKDVIHSFIVKGQVYNVEFIIFNILISFALLKWIFYARGIA